MTIVTEHDVRLARLAARELCQRLGARTLSQQKVATAVSELSRNIASYTPGGELTLTPVDGAPPRLTILATDRGRGIAELESILSGTYRSRTGLGRGLRGVKQLMDRFEIRTGPTGTRIEAEAILR